MHQEGIEEGQAQQQTSLELRALTKSYGSVEVLKGLDLSVHAGEIFGFLGRNGAGKSTAIRILMGITKPSGGEVRLFGEPLTNKNQRRLRQRIGYVAQDQAFYPWMTPRTLGKFVRGFYPTWDDKKYDHLLTRLELPHNRKIGTFSGGMKAKVALSVALAHSPALLLLDEPTAGLDPVARREFIEMIRDEAVRSGATTFFSTHLIDEIEIAAHRVGIVDEGLCRYEGTVADLQSRHVLLFVEDPNDAAPPPAFVSDTAHYRVVSQRWQGTQKRMLVELAEPARGLTAEQGLGAWQIATLPLEELFIEMVRRPM